MEPTTHTPHVAVTGLNATDNPGPGISVIRALRHDPDFDGRIVGLAYDNLEPGVYAKALVDDVFLVPYPSQGVSALAARLRYIHERVRLDALIPTLDTELPALIALEPELAEMGIGTFLPTRQQLDLRAKQRLAVLGRKAELAVPETRVIWEPAALYSIHRHISYPLVIKGPLYGATVVRSVHEAVQAFYGAIAAWGAPVIAQAMIVGQEYNVVAVGDGEGGLVGAVPMRKTSLTDKGKGWAGVAVSEQSLLELTRRFVEATRWRGPFELEMIRDAHGVCYLIEVNPRFPAWVFLSAAAGLNLPRAVLQLALGQSVAPLTEYRPGTMFVRISVDQVAQLDDFQQLAMTGELISQGAPS